MVNHGFCKPCRIMLENKSRIGGLENLPHHLDANSFQLAILEGCHICVQAWARGADKITYGKRTFPVTTYHRWKSDIKKGLNFEIVLIANIPVFVNFTLLPWSLDYAYMNDTKSSTTDQSGTWLSDNSGSEKTFEFIHSKFKECLTRHRVCSSTNTNRYLPTRLLDVGDAAHSIVRSVSKREIPADALYTTLSHCWGESVPLKLTSTTETALRDGIADEQLPRTFEQAVAVTRKLEIRYIWIDSLCIYQDSIEDWSLEAASMYDVYSYAVLNIAATAAASGDVGLFFSREARKLEPFRVDIAWPAQEMTAETPFRSFLCFTYRSVDELINKSPLNQRAWVMQERHLSQRIVHYTHDEVFWECGESFVSETQQIHHPIESRNSPDRGARGLKWLLTYHGESHQTNDEEESEMNLIDERQMDNAWAEFRYWFAGCKITKDEDRLVALAGIVKQLSDVTQDEFFAGFWKSRFLQELCWGMYSTHGARRSSLWVAPTWSWASYTSSVFNAASSCEKWVDVAEIVSIEVETKVSGALVEGAFLLIRCRLVAVRLHLNLKAVTIKENLHCYGRGGNGYGFFHNIYLDNDSLKVEHPEAILAVLQEGRRVFSGPKDTMAGLILIPSANNIDVYERIGLFIGYYGDDNFLSSFWADCTERFRSSKEEVIKII